MKCQFITSKSQVLKLTALLTRLWPAGILYCDSVNCFGKQFPMHLGENNVLMSVLCDTGLPVTQHLLPSPPTAVRTNSRFNPFQGIP